MDLSSMLRAVVLGGAVVAVASANVGCAPEQETEARGSATSKLLAPYKAMQTPASNTKRFAEALGGVPVDINGWRGFVAGTITDQKKADNALFAVHLSGVKGDKAVAGITVAFTEDTPGSGSLDERIKNASGVQVRFNNGSGIVSTHSFVSGQTVSAHAKDENSDSLLKRAFNDSNALLTAPSNQSNSADDSKACLANYLTTVSHAARCVNDATNSEECDSVRDAAVATAATCAGTDTANVLAGASTSQVHTSDFNFGSLLPLFGSFFNILKPGAASTTTAANPLSAITGLLGAFAGGSSPTATSLLGGAGGLMGLFSKFFGGSTSLSPTAFGNPTGVTSVLASPLTGGVSLNGLTSGLGF